MGTKYILIGGRVWMAEDSGRAFCVEAAKGLGKEIKILVCVFAEPEEKWQKKFVEDTEYFKKNLPQHDLAFELASHDDFIAQLSRSDIIFLHGGTTQRIINAMQKQSGWIELLRGKVLAGTSAGALLIAKYGFNCDDVKIINGLGLLPVKVIPHFRSDYNSPNIDWDKADAELKAYKEDLPIYALKEGEFAVIET